MRFDTHKASAHLVQKLKATGAVIRHDGGDIILIVSLSGHKISIHLIESPIPLYEIRSILAQNNADDIYTLFIFWCDMLLPREGVWYEPDDWMAAMLALYGGRIYGYELYGGEVYIFPVYFDGQAAARHIRYGDTVERAYIECHTIRTKTQNTVEFWRVADFASRPFSENWHYAGDAGQSAPKHLSSYYTILEIAESADLETIKRAYRILARKYHPDLNAAPEATQRMQQINEAYQWIMRQFEE
jgi:hypothetical protein